MMKTLAERLGFSPDARVAIIHADDVGMTHSHNLGFFEVSETGSVTSGSVMVPGPWFPEVVEWARGREGVDLGVHLCLNSEYSGLRWRPLSGSRVPSLMDREGYFLASPAEALERVDPEEVRIELRAQIDRAQDAGIDVTHLDAHMGTVMMQPLFPVYLSLGREYHLPLFFPRPSRALLEEVGRADMIGSLDTVLAEFDSSGVLMVDHVELRSLSFDPDRAEEHYRQVFSELRPGVTHLLLHPATGDEELRAILPDAWRLREAERRVFARPEMRRWLDEAGIRRIGYRPLRDLLREG
jgi:chitin disaccharide deacetylase